MNHKIYRLFFSLLFMTGVAMAQQSQTGTTTNVEKSAASPSTVAAISSQPDTPEEVEDAEWPKEFTSGKSKILVYQPQIDSWDGFNLSAHSALGVNPEGGKEFSVFGVVYFTAHTLTDKESRQATLQDITVSETSFPSDKNQESTYAKMVQDTFAKKSSSNIVSLDRLEETYSGEQQQQASQPIELKNDAPKFIFSDHPALLVSIDGDPTYQAVKGTNVQRVLNTHVILLKDSAGELYLRVFDGWMTSGNLADGWTVVKNPPASILQAYAILKDTNVDLLQGGNPDDPTSLPKLAKGAPEIFVVTEPAELIVSDGQPNYVPVEGTKLLYISNTSANVFKDLTTQKTFVLTSGRWFAAGSTSGPWTYVPNNQLPKDFAAIPDTSDKENVKASVAGTEQAHDALIDNSVPQTAKISRKEAHLTKANCDGQPDFAPIDQTNLESAQNCSRPLMKDANNYYTLENGIWFVANSPNGPWIVADKIPADMYKIPTRHPLHYVTYVRVYDSTPDYVYVGYTPGYYGSYVGDGVVVYGTGYYYRPWVRSAWYGYPWTYGFGVGIGYTPWTGWGWGFGYGWRWSGPTVMVGWGWGVHPWWGPYRYYGPGRYRWYGYNRSVYGRWNSRAVVRVGPASHTRVTWQSRTALSYNSHSGRIVAGQNAKVTNAFGNDRHVIPVGSASPNHVENSKERNSSNNIGREANQKNSKSENNKGENHQPMNLGRAANENRRNNNNVYGDRNGIFRSKDGGGWEQRGQGNQWEDVKDTDRIQALEREKNARSRGDTRAGRTRQFMNDDTDDRGNDDRGNRQEKAKTPNRNGHSGFGGGHGGKAGGGGHRR